ncbi:uncharacterized protein G2W53_043917 [Senna tora]|uniref:RNase H type-1 domain-containing protein n=1 Tax=Senna tora TaxID=362788 RepID=A0A834SJY0_9FABA|nr:uncharacterized protein G2W53_043917 [Senna tora]
MSASCGHRPSAIWRSLMAGRSVLSKGLRRSIGNGRATEIWSDPWIPSDVPLVLQRPDHIASENELVSDLLTENGTEWDDEKLRARFDDNTYIRIKSIPPDTDQGEDRWVWERDNKGIYSVKTGYRCVLAEVWSGFELGLDIDEGATMRFWKRMWKLPLISRYKFANEVIRAEELWARVEKVMDELQTVMFNDDRNRAEPTSFKWEKPEYPYKKLNVDAVTNKEGGGAMGGVIRDETGVCVAVCMNSVQFPNEPILLEAMAIKKGLELAYKVGCTHGHFTIL